MKILKFVRKIYSKVHDFCVLFFEQSAIHGFGYLAKTCLTRIEKFFWFLLILISLYFCIILSLESLDRYNTKSTVVSIEKDHYYWNTSLPSLTICPMKRISETKFNEYCRIENINGDLKEEFFEFLESLANSSYLNFENIKASKGVDSLFIDPQDYMSLIFNLTEDLTRIPSDDHRVRTLNNFEFIRAQQVLTEYGICYLTNSFLSDRLSASLLITGKPPPENIFDHQPDVVLHEVRFGNLFDGDITYSFIGFDSAISMFLHSPYETLDIGRNLGYAEDAFEFEVYSMEIITTEDFQKDTTIAQRGCRFNHESNLTHFRVYTKGICLQECRLNLAYKKCRCIPHFYPNRIADPKRVCHYKTLKTCFPKYKSLFITLHSHDHSDHVDCYCVQNCQESKVIVERMQMMGDSEDLLGSIGGLVIVKKYPLIRFKRQILFSFTDLLGKIHIPSLIYRRPNISVGGTAGLLQGFSVLGAVEIIYFFTLRFFWYLRGRK